MKIRVRVPKVGLTVEEVTLAAWEKREGDTVAAEEVIATVEGDKATIEIISPLSGILIKQIVPVGEIVPIGTEIAIIES